MAIKEKVVDDQTGETITYPYISARSLRVEISPTKFVWMGREDILAFSSGKNLGEWAEKRLEEILDEVQDPEVGY